MFKKLLILIQLKIQLTLKNKRNKKNKNKIPMIKFNKRIKFRNKMWKLLLLTLNNKKKIQNK